MNHVRLTIALGLAALTAACGKKAEAPVATETNEAAHAATMSGDMGNMSMAPDANAAIKAKAMAPSPRSTRRQARSRSIMVRSRRPSGPR